MERALQQSAAVHRHLCPRQVLGVRMGMFAGRWLGLDLPGSDKRLFVFMETDGCASDGVAVATGAWVGRRTMRIMDFGEVAATFVDTVSGHAVRIHPHADSRAR
ncbi:MAG TPA: formylmethanofuran dehydrogenase subunit E family protein, partial [Anaerolineales bacterium]|nr:formylmethanofuran dehydrogenase subunit E family protein [Anaerolineales bacterium]